MAKQPEHSSVTEPTAEGHRGPARSKRKIGSSSETPMVGDFWIAAWTKPSTSKGRSELSGFGGGREFAGWLSFNRDANPGADTFRLIPMALDNHFVRLAGDESLWGSLPAYAQPDLDEASARELSGVADEVDALLAGFDERIEAQHRILDAILADERQ